MSAGVISKCSSCGISFVFGDRHDEADHLVRCADTTNGPPLNCLPDDRVAGNVDGVQVLFVTAYSSAAQRARAAKVALHARRDAGFDFPSYVHSDGPEPDDPHVFMLRVNNRAASFCVMRRHEDAHVATWRADGLFDVGGEVRGRWYWTVEMLWTARGMRRMGWAWSVLKIAASSVKADPLVWALPFTDSGIAFARTCSLASPLYVRRAA